MLINELITGPCKENQEAVMDYSLLKNLNGLLMRMISDTSSEFYNLKHASLLLIVSLTEG
jgi:hypothetical protein